MAEESTTPEYRPSPEGWRLLSAVDGGPSPYWP
jgi:hypothetical protein